ncbi:MAG: patatin-like phospholipase family protein [Bdellovibrio sp.]
MKTAFVLSGGGAAGSYQFGCLKALLEYGIKPDFMTANSAGSLNAVGLSFGSVVELETVWRSIKSQEDVFPRRLFKYLGLPFGGRSLWHSYALKEKIDKMIKGRQPKIPVWVSYVDLIDGKLVHELSANTRSFRDATLASASIPIITEPVNGHMVDGAVRENTPLKFAIDQGAERIFVFMNNPVNKELDIVDDPKNIFQIASRCLSILSDEALLNDIKTCQMYNSLGLGRNIELHWIAPKVRTVGTLDFNQEAISRGIDEGYQQGKEFLAVQLTG